jgi:hypothetical protein
MSSQSKASEAIRLLAYLDSGKERQEPDQLITNPGSILLTQLWKMKLQSSAPVPMQRA